MEINIARVSSLRTGSVIAWDIAILYAMQQSVVE